MIKKKNSYYFTNKLLNAVKHVSFLSYFIIYLLIYKHSSLTIDILSFNVFSSLDAYILDISILLSVSSR